MSADLEAMAEFEEFDDFVDFEDSEGEEFGDLEGSDDLADFEAFDDFDDFGDAEDFDDEDGLDAYDDQEDDFDAYDDEDGFDAYDGEDDFDSEDPFIKGLFRGLKKVGGAMFKGIRGLGRSLGSIFKRLAPIAARIVGGVIGGPAGAAIGNTIASAVLREAEEESEAESEAALAESEDEFESMGGDPEEYAAMEEAAAEAAESESLHESDEFIRTMARHAFRLFRGRRVSRSVTRRVLRAAAALSRTFRANRRTRWAIRMIPVIVRRTLTRLARSRRVTRQQIVRVMARETAWVLASRRRAQAALRRHRRFRVRARRTPLRRYRGRRSFPVHHRVRTRRPRYVTRRYDDRRWRVRYPLRGKRTRLYIPVYRF